MLTWRPTPDLGMQVDDECGLQKLLSRPSDHKDSVWNLRKGGRTKETSLAHWLEACHEKHDQEIKFSERMGTEVIEAAGGAGGGRSNARPVSITKYSAATFVQENIVCRVGDNIRCRYGTRKILATVTKVSAISLSRSAAASEAPNISCPCLQSSICACLRTRVWCADLHVRRAGSRGCFGTGFL